MRSIKAKKRKDFAFYVDCVSDLRDLIFSYPKAAQLIKLQPLTELEKKSMHPTKLSTRCQREIDTHKSVKLDTSCQPAFRG